MHGRPRRPEGPARRHRHGLDWDKISKALKPVCTAPTQDAAEERFLEFDVEIRRGVCTTNAIGSVNARIREAVRACGHLPDGQAALKCVYTAVMSLDPTGQGRKRRAMRGKPALQAFDVGYWNSFFNVMLHLPTDAQKWPLQYVLLTYVNRGFGSTRARTAPLSLQMAVVVLTLVPLLLVYPFMQKHFRTGVLTGAVKG